MGITQEIQKTRIHCDNTKRIKTKINDVIKNLDGEYSKTISQIPTNLNNLIKKYRKVAKKTMNIQVGWSSEHPAIIYFNASFPPKQAFIKLTNNVDREETYVDISKVIPSGGQLYTDFVKNHYPARLHISNSEGGFKIYNQDAGGAVYFIKELMMIG